MKIKIPFKKIFAIAIVASRKVATTRTKRYGKIGDCFCIGINRKIKCKILSVSKEKLCNIAKYLYREEGFKSEQEFRKFWLTIHRKWTPEKKFYLHIFRRRSK